MAGELSFPYLKSAYHPAIGRLSIMEPRINPITALPRAGSGSNHPPAHHPPPNKSGILFVRNARGAAVVIKIRRK